MYEPFRVEAKARLLLLPFASNFGERFNSSTLDQVNLVGVGVDTTIYSAYSTCGTSASNAANQVVPTEAILSASCWKLESIFTRFIVA